MVRKLAILALVIAGTLSGTRAHAAQPGYNSIDIRGKAQEVYYVPTRVTPALGTILFSPGDGGWRGIAIDWAQKMSLWGYDVYGIDTTHYLESLGSKSGLRPEEVTADYAELANKLVSPNTPVMLVGWSEGASLSLLAALGTDAKPSRFSALVVIGMPEVGILGWKWKDALTWVTKKMPEEPQFRASDYIPRLRVPFLILRSSQDAYTTAESAQHQLAAAAPPKRLVTVQSDNHRFSSNRDGFFRELQAALEWSKHPVKEQARE
jgi:pimeloyl-ACP methyl ester carboxylesterase